MDKKGWIVLDIDGTITLEKHTIPQPVLLYLKELNSQGWTIAFATGRSYTFASIPLSHLDFPFFFLPQNGSVSLLMPEKIIIEKNYLTRDDLTLANQVCLGLEAEPLVYGGFELADRCFYRDNCFSQEGLSYIAELEKREGEIACPISSYDQCNVNSFPLVKYFGPAEKIKRVARALENIFQVTHIKDPFVPGTELLLVTNAAVSKGFSLARLFEKEGRGDRVIAAGDDANDLSMFAIADIAIAMPHAPALLLEKADLIAAPTAQMGIIQALKKAISR